MNCHRHLPSKENQIWYRQLPRTGTVESSSRQTSWFHLFTYKRFHVLLNSLFKVLCNFPSRYLFAIGLAVIFSLRWSLPPALGCTLKQPDSNTPRYASRSLVAMGLAPALERVPVRGTCDDRKVRHSKTLTLHLPYAARRRDLALDFSLFARRY